MLRSLLDLSSLFIRTKSIKMISENGHPIVCYKLFSLGEYRHRSLGMLDKLDRSMRRISSIVQPSRDGKSLRFLASDNTLHSLRTIEKFRSVDMFWLRTNHGSAHVPTVF